MIRLRVAALVLAACSSAPERPVAVTAAPARPAWSVRPAGGTRPIDPGPAGAELLDARACAPCHAAIVDEWAKSRHALAWTNSIFQTEYGVRPQPWCVNCHAPLTTQQRDLAGREAAQGVDCATCHVRDGKLVAASKRATSPHDTVADASFGSPAYCADCHQFTFPQMSAAGEAVAMTQHPMQTTVASFAAGPYAAERDGCMTCHGSKHDHAFPGAHDPGMLAAAVEVTWCRAAQPDTITVRVKNAAAGHTVPTGDIHRHMYLRVWRSSAPAALVQAFYGRRFEPADDGGKTTSWDSTLAPQQTRTLTVTASALEGELDEPINLELVYVYLANEFPRPRNLPAEPTTRSMTSQRVRFGDLPPCP